MERSSIKRRRRNNGKAAPTHLSDEDERIPKRRSGSSPPADYLYSLHLGHEDVHPKSHNAHLGHPPAGHLSYPTPHTHHTTTHTPNPHHVLTYNHTTHHAPTYNHASHHTPPPSDDELYDHGYGYFDNGDFDDDPVPPRLSTSTLALTNALARGIVLDVVRAYAQTAPLAHPDAARGMVEKWAGGMFDLPVNTAEREDFLSKLHANTVLARLHADVPALQRTSARSRWDLFVCSAARVRVHANEYRWILERMCVSPTGLLDKLEMLEEVEAQIAVAEVEMRGG